MILPLHKKYVPLSVFIRLVGSVSSLLLFICVKAFLKVKPYSSKPNRTKHPGYVFFFFFLVLVCVCKDLFCVIHSSDSALNNSPSSRFGSSTIRDYSSPVKINEFLSQRRMKPPPESYPSWQTADLRASLVGSFSMYLALLLLPVLLGC